MNSVSTQKTKLRVRTRARGVILARKGSEKWAFDFLNVIEPRALARAGFLGSLDDEGTGASRASSHSIRATEGVVDGRFTADAWK
jgi:hypothetical protein